MLQMLFLFVKAASPPLESAGHMLSSYLIPIRGNLKKSLRLDLIARSNSYITIIYKITKYILTTLDALSCCASVRYRVDLLRQL